MSASDPLRALLAQQAAVRGKRVVTSAHPAGAAAGIEMYARGGNAFDAALAAAFVEEVALPMRAGLAGDVVGLARRDGGEWRALVSIGAGPRALADGAALERLGPRSVGAPGAPDGYAALHANARLPLDVLVGPAVRAAREGVAWMRVGVRYLEESRALLEQHNPHGCVYLPQGRMPQVGDVRQAEGLATLYERFAALGAALFHGEEGERIVAALAARGGFLAMEDLRARTARWAAPASIDLAGRTLIATPRPTHGPALLDAMRRAVIERVAPVEAALQARRAQRAAGRAVGDEGTSVTTAADEAGNAVVIVHSNSFPRFGSGVVLDNGLVLANRPGRGFDLKAPPGAANAPAAGKVPFTTLHCWALPDAATTYAGGTPGGVNQMPWNLQTLLRVLAEEPIGDIVVAPRWALDDEDRLSMERDGTAPAGVTETALVDALSYRSIVQILKLAPGALIEAAADPRTGAVACGMH
jgi:gamma-glutamyltranspeptidase/glutathione hydrolase